MSERFTPPASTETPRRFTKFDVLTGEWRPLNSEEFLRAEDQPGSVRELGIPKGERHWLLDWWDDMILGIRKESIVKERIEAKAFLDSHFAPDRMAKRFQIPEAQERTVQRIK